jgi:curved DNA-binding protein CbpA
VRRDYEDLQGADPWAVLGVSRDAGDGDIKRAFRRLVRELHPDTTGDPEGFKPVGLAYAIVSEPARAADYADRLRRAAEPARPPVEPEVAEAPPVYTDPFAWRDGAGPDRREPRRPEPSRYAEPSRYTEPPSSFLPPPAYRAPWNRLAIISLAITFLCWPVSFFVAIAALAQVRSTGERGAGLAWAAIVLSVAPVAVYGGALLFSGQPAGGG